MRSYSRPSPGPLIVEEFQEGMRQASDIVKLPELDSAFHLDHRHIIISGMDIPKEDGKSHVHVADIIDWERAGFCPRF